MTKLPARIRRHNLLVAKIAKLKAAREAAIKTIVRVETTLPKFERELARRERGVPERAVADDLVASMREPAAALSPEILAEAKATADLPDIPAFLVRTGDDKDAAARAEIKEQQATDKKRKAERRIAKLKVGQDTKRAELTGQRRRMPLTGKEALAAIRGG